MSPRASMAGISPHGTRTGVTSLIDRPSMRKRSMMKTSCVEPGQMPIFLPLRSLTVFTSEPALAITPMPLLDMAPTTTTGSPPAHPRPAAGARGGGDGPGRERFGARRFLAVGRAGETDALVLEVGRRDLLVEVGRHGVAQPQG